MLTETQPIKVVLVGDTQVGKTSIVNAYARKTEKTVPTIGANSFSFAVKLNDSVVNLSVWDTAGQEEFKCLVPMYAWGAQVAVVVFDLSNKDSFNSVNGWIESVVEDYAIPNIIVVGNKVDLESFCDYQNLVIEYKDKDIEFLQTSAVTGAGIDTLFYSIATKTLAATTAQSETTTFIPRPQLEETNNKPCC